MLKAEIKEFMKKAHVKKIKPVKQDSMQLSAGPCVPAINPPVN